MTLADLRTELADRLHELQTATNPYWTLTWRDKILNEGCSEFVFLTHCLEGKKAEFDIVADQVEYDLNTLITDFLCISQDGKIIYQESATNHVPIIVKDTDWLDKNYSGWRTADSSDPQYAFIRQRRYLGLVPAGDTAITNGALVYYTPAPPTMSSATHYPFDLTTNLVNLVPYHAAIADYGAWKGWLLRDEKKAAQYQDSFFSRVKYFNMKNGKNTSEVPDRATKSIKVAMSKMRSRY